MMQQVLHALSMAFAMFWQILWALILGFGLSAVVQAVVGKEQMTKLLPDDSPHFDSTSASTSGRLSKRSYARTADGGRDCKSLLRQVGGEEADEGAGWAGHGGRGAEGDRL